MNVIEIALDIGAVAVTVAGAGVLWMVLERVYDWWGQP